MNRTEFETKWDSMTPRERDAWVAVEVMGWEETIYEESHQIRHGWAFKERERVEITTDYTIDEVSDFFRAEEYFNPTEDISSAMEVIDKYESEGDSISLETGCPGQEWICKIGEAYAWGHTKMEAICKAGIKAFIIAKESQY